MPSHYQDLPELCRESGRHAANRVGPFSLGVPVVGLAAGMCLLGEQVSRWQWTGALLVITALLVVIWPARRPSD
jgi:O-acetylserine/cysteine efflux transporter